MKLQESTCCAIRRAARVGTGALVVMATVCAHAPAILAASLDVSTLGARTDETLATVTVYVDQNSPNASDSNAGTQTRPFKTVSRAAQFAMDYNTRGIGVRVEVASGTYRESVQLAATGHDSSAPMIFEGSPSGSAIIAGSDVWSGWTPSGSDGTYSHDWPYTWGLAPYPDGWSCCVTLSDMVRRREMVFANGQRQHQVLTMSAMTPGSFFVSETAHLIYMKPTSDVSMASATIEVAVRSAVFLVQHRTNVVLRGLVFRHDDSMLGSTAALTVRNSSDVRIDQCTMEWNNFQGIGITSSDHVSVSATVSDSNGLTGMAGWQLTSSLVSDSEMSYNNWRGYEGSFTDWDPAGIKLMLLRDTAVVRTTTNGNLSYGLWLDTDCVNVLIQMHVSNSNLNDGIMLEAVQGPVEISNSMLNGNARSGLVSGNASNVTLNSNVMTSNSKYQILFSGDPNGRPVQNFQSGQGYVVQSAGWVLNSNVIKSDDAGVALVATTLPLTRWQALVSTLTSDWNKWFNSADRAGMRWVNGAPIDLGTWQE